MRLVLHIVAKDLRRLRWPLLLWLVITAVPLVFGFSMVLGGDFDQALLQKLEPATLILRLLAGVATFFLTAQLIQEDGLVGTTQFWSTRPIAHRRLLAAKFTGWWLMLGLPPVLLALPWWVTCGFGAGEIARAALELWMVQVAIALPVALIASLTDTLGRVIIWSFPLMFCTMFATGLLATVLEKAEITAWSTTMLFFAVTAAAVIVRQFLRPDLRRSIVWLVIGLSAAPLLAIGINPIVQAWLQRSAAWTNLQAERLDGLGLSVHAWRAASGVKSPEDEVLLQTNLRVDGLPADLVLDSGSRVSARQRWEWTGIPPLERDAHWIGAWSGMTAVRRALELGPDLPDPETQRHTDAQWAQRIARMPDRGAALQAQRALRSDVPAGLELHTRLRASSIERIRRTPPRYTVTLQLRALQPEVWTRVPLLAGGWHAHAGHGFRFTSRDGARPTDDTGPAPTELRLHAVVTTPTFLWQDFFGRPGRWSTLREPALLIVHPKADALGTPRVGGLALTVASVRIRSSQLTLKAPLVYRGERWVTADPEWTRSAEIAQVGFREVARFTRTVHSAPFPAEVGRPASNTP